MSYKRIDLNEGWKLGWQKDPVLNKWIVGFNSWKVEKGRLAGAPTSLTRGLIYANCKAAGDQDVKLKLTLPEEGCDLRPIACYCMTRLAGYYLVFHPGQKISIYYVYSELFDHQVADNLGPVIEAGKEYTLELKRRGQQMSVVLDGENICDFEIKEYCGDYLALAAMAGTSYVSEVTVSDGEGQQLFFDDFSVNSIPECVDVELDALECDNWIDAVVPGTVHTALLNAGVIEDPYIPFNGEKCHWVCDQRWIYKKTFTVPEEFKGKRLRLLFNGVDYRAYFWLNGTKLCFHEGMFGGPELDITQADELSVILSSNDLEKLEETLLAELKAKMLTGVTLKANDNVDGGFRIAVDGDGAYYDYSKEAVTDMLSNYLSPKITALLKEAE